jgi:hypothetical protein
MLVSFMSDPKRCELHSRDLVKGFAGRIHDSCVRGNGYFQAREQFPHGRCYVLFGSPQLGTASIQRRAPVMYCPECRKAERRWWAQHRNFFERMAPAVIDRLPGKTKRG